LSLFLCHIIKVHRVSTTSLLKVCKSLGGIQHLHPNFKGVYSKLPSFSVSRWPSAIMPPYVAAKSSHVLKTMFKTSWPPQGTNPLCKGSRHCRWDLAASMTSRVGINDNFINNLPLCHWWQQLMLPLWACSHFVIISPFVFISPPLASMAKGDHISVSGISDHYSLLPLSICTILGPVCMPGVTILSPLSSFSSLVNSRCVNIFERPYTWLAIWQPSSLLWSTSPICNCSVFLIHTCFLASVLWAFDSSSVLAFLDELYRKLLTCCFWVLQQY